jgi:hypothetical protein
MNKVQEALKAAIETLEIEGIGGCDAAELCKSALAEMGKYEPVAYMSKTAGNVCVVNPEKLLTGFYDLDDYSIPLYTSPISKEWVGLSDDEKDNLYKQYWIDKSLTFEDLINTIEAKLKQLNAEKG